MRSRKVCLIGNSDAGKTSIMNAYLGLPIDTEVTVVANFRALPVTYIKDSVEHQVKFQVVDTAGQERYCHVLPPVLFRDADAGFVIFDLNEPQSLLGLDKRIEHFRNYSKCDSVLFLVGNKRDLVQDSKLQSQMLQDQIHKLMNKYQIAFYFKTSALTGTGIQDLFQTAAQLMDTLTPFQDFNVVQHHENNNISLQTRTSSALKGIYQFCKM